MRVIFFVIMGCMVVTASCRRSVQPVVVSVPDHPVTTNRIVAATTKDWSSLPLLEYSKTACFGSCPVFSVTFFPDGKAEWEGEKNIKRLGRYQANVPAGWIDAIVRTATEQGIFNMAHQYPVNGIAVSDLPQAILVLKGKDGPYKITVGADAPLSLQRFQEYLEQKVEELYWNKK